MEFAEATIASTSAPLAEGRLRHISNPNTAGVTGLCLEVHDLAISKYVSGREKDREFTKALAQHGMTQRATLLARERDTNLSAGLRRIVKARIERDFKQTAK